MSKARRCATHLEPSDTTAKSNYAIYDRRVRFGLDAPLDSGALYELGQGLYLGANVSFGLANMDFTDAENNESDGSIGTDLLTFALDAQWTGSEGLYADAQARYAGFSGDITSQQESMTFGNDVGVLSLSGKIGSCFDVLGFSFVSQAQVGGRG